jgi:hypothetical protein
MPSARPVGGPALVLETVFEAEDRSLHGLERALGARLLAQPLELGEQVLARDPAEHVRVGHCLPARWGLDDVAFRQVADFADQAPAIAEQ